MKKQLRNLLIGASLCSLFIAPCSSFAQVPSYVPTNGLVGYWPFNGNANDESGNGNNGTVNGAMLTMDRFGNPNSAYYFSSAGCATHIACNINTNSITEGLTISFWANRAGNGCISPRIMKFFAPGDGPGTHVFNWPNSNNFPSIAFVTSAMASPFYHYNTLQNDLWSNIVFTNDGSYAKLYQDGVLISSNASTGSISLSGNANFGRMVNPANDAFNGSLDDIGIWNRALSETEIAALYNGCSNSLSSQPTDQSIELSAGNTAQFSTTSSATTASYQWQTNLGLGFQNLSDAGQYSGSTTNTLSVNNVTLANNNQQFRCIVADGSCEDTTDVAVLTVIDDLGIEDLKPNGSKKLLKITDLNGKETPFRKNTVLLFIYEDGTVERVFEAE